MSDELKKYRVGLIGGGRQGTCHAIGYQYHPRTELVAVADTDAENLEIFCRRFNVKGYESYEEMLEKENLDISAPNLPVKVNPAAVIASAKAGVKAIFCEKPLAASLEDADRMVEECLDRKVLLAAGLVVSSHPDYRKAYRMAADGEIGEIRRINLYEGNKQMGTHGLNLARKFAGKADVDFVIGWVSGDPQGEHEEDYGEGNSWYGYLAGYIRFSNGIECFSSYNPIPWRGIEVVGTRGVIFNQNDTAVGIKLFNSSANHSSSDQEPKQFDDLEEIKGVFEDYSTPPRDYDEEGWRKPSETMMETIQNIVESLDQDKELEVTTGDDLRHALEIAIALRESARKGHSPVSLPIKDRGLIMYPVAGRWNYKKDLYGAEWYREQLKLFKKE